VHELSGGKQDRIECFGFIQVNTPDELVFDANLFKNGYKVIYGKIRRDVLIDLEIVNKFVKQLEMTFNCALIQMRHIIYQRQSI